MRAAVVGEALIWTLDYGLGEAFTEEVKGAWLESIPSSCASCS